MNIENSTSDDEIKELERSVANLKNIEYFLNNIDLVLKSLNNLYYIPLKNRQLYLAATEIIKNNGIIQLMSKILSKINIIYEPNINESILNIFNLICSIIITYADDRVEFRQYSTNSALIKTLVNIISYDANNPENIERNRFIVCVNSAIRALYNVTRLENEIERYRKLEIAPILIKRLKYIHCERTRVCAILCLGYTMNLNEIEGFDERALNDITFIDGVTYAFSLLNKALQAGNENSENMFCCYLGKHGELPYFWAYEIVDAISKWTKNKQVTNFISEHSQLFGFIIDLYLNGNIAEKESASYAILICSFNSKLMEIIVNHKELLARMKIDHGKSSDILKMNLSQLKFLLTFQPSFNSIDYHKLENNLNETSLNFLLKIQNELESLENKYQRFFSQECIHFKHFHDTLLNRISELVVEKSCTYDDTKSKSLEVKENCMFNLILMRVKYFVKHLTNIYSQNINYQNSKFMFQSVSNETAIEIRQDEKLSIEVYAEKENKKRRSWNIEEELEILKTHIFSPAEYSKFIEYLILEGRISKKQGDSASKLHKLIENLLMFSFKNFNGE